LDAISSLNNYYSGLLKGFGGQTIGYASGLQYLTQSQIGLNLHRALEAGLEHNALNYGVQAFTMEFLDEIENGGNSKSSTPHFLSIKFTKRYEYFVLLLEDM
jgi:hypothetical protein